jgi:hypothetical protein
MIIDKFLIFFFMSYRPIGLGTGSCGGGGGGGGGVGGSSGFSLQTPLIIFLFNFSM